MKVSITLPASREDGERGKREEEKLENKKTTR